MNDFSSFHIPPRDISSLESTQPSSASKKPAQQIESNPFKDTLRQALGDMSQQAETISNAAAPRFEEMQIAMDSAKNAFQQTMQAHQLMQTLIQDIEPEGKK
ncbi:MAG: hypothetical protein ACOX5R_16240 [bacterium]|jgi:hypothetical protein